MSCHFKKNDGKGNHDGDDNVVIMVENNTMMTGGDDDHWRDESGDNGGGDGDDGGAGGDDDGRDDSGDDGDGDDGSGSDDESLDGSGDDGGGNGDDDDDGDDDGRDDSGHDGSGDDSSYHSLTPFYSTCHLCSVHGFWSQQVCVRVPGVEKISIYASCHYLFLLLLLNLHKRRLESSIIPRKQYYSCFIEEKTDAKTSPEIRLSGRTIFYFPQINPPNTTFRKSVKRLPFKWIHLSFPLR